MKFEGLNGCYFSQFNVRLNGEPLEEVIVLSTMGLKGSGWRIRKRYGTQNECGV